MPLGPLHNLRSLGFVSGDNASNDVPSSVKSNQTTNTNSDQLLSRRRFLASATATGTVGFAGCSGHLPGNAETIDSSIKRDENTLIWNYPASAVQRNGRNEGIGYAAIRFRAVNTAADTSSAAPVLGFRLNSTVGDIAAGKSYQGYQADWFQFYVGVPQTYDGLSGLRTFVQPLSWPELQTTYGYEDSVRELSVKAPCVNEKGTITVDGRFRPSRATFPRELHCQFKIQASQSGTFGRTVLANGRATFDVSELDLPEGVTVE